MELGLHGRHVTEIAIVVFKSEPGSVRVAPDPFLLKRSHVMSRHVLVHIQISGVVGSLAIKIVAAENEPGARYVPVAQVAQELQ